MYTKFMLPKSCECSDCILYPEHSHGMHMVGIYRSPVMLLSRGHILPEGVAYDTASNRGLVTPIFGSAAGPTYTRIIP